MAAGTARQGEPSGVDMDDGDVTLAEVNRNVTSVRTDLRDLSKDIVDLKVSSSTTQDKVRRLESIVYGSMAASAAAVVTSVMGVVSSQGG